MNAAGQWLALMAALGAAVALGGQPPDPAPPASAGSVPTAHAAAPATTPAAGTPDDEFIEFLGGDDDAVRWNLTTSAQRKGRPPVVPTQDATS